jgi:hypothetical protein
MIARALFVLALAAPLARCQQPPQQCPWLSAGTAATALGAEVTVSAHSDSNWSGSCRFTTSSKEQSIEVTVGRTDPHACGPSATSVAAIGNEAALCSKRGSGGPIMQVLAGRVRDAWFVVKMTLPPSAPPASSSEGEPSDSASVRFLAEQIAGNLY